ncbi:hypothetical protein ACNF49_01670 [Actinomadura sp. ATCC 39365]
MRKQTLLALALAATAALSACGGPGEGAPATQAGPKQGQALSPEAKGSLDLSLLRVVEADFDPYSTPEELAADRPVVAAGIIDGWQQGPILKTYPGGPLDHRVVLRMRVTEALKGVKGRKTIPDGLVYIELSQGGVVSDPNVPVEQWKPRKSIADFEKALPVGTKMLAFPRERPVQELEVHDPGEPLPRDAKLMLVPPQGLIFEDPQLVGQRSGGTALVGGKERLSVGGEAWSSPRDMGELVARLKQHGITE